MTTKNALGARESFTLADGSQGRFYRLAKLQEDGHCTLSTLPFSIRVLLEAALRDTGDQFVTVAEMPVGRGGADTDRAGHFGETKAGRSKLGDQIQGSLYQGLAQIAVMIAAPAAAAFRFTHVKVYYMSGRGVARILFS